MNRPGIGEGVLFALIAAVITVVSAVVLSIALSGPTLLTTVTSAVAFLYILYLLRRSGERVGRVIVATGFLVLVGVALALSPSPLTHLLLLAGAIWITRALYYYQSALLALVDLGIVIAGTITCLWAWQTSHSPGLTVWTFFLVQSLFVLVPSTLANAGKREMKDSDAAVNFSEAHEAARAAARELASQYQ